MKRVVARTARDRKFFLKVSIDVLMSRPGKKVPLSFCIRGLSKTFYI